MSTYTKFNAPLSIKYETDLSKVKGRDFWSVSVPFSFYVGKVEDNVVVEIPLGYTTDGASVPRIFWWVVPPWGNYGQSAVVHDFLLEKKFLLVNGTPNTVSRKLADKIFREAMLVAGVNPITAHVMYAAVCLYTAFLAVRKSL